MHLPMTLTNDQDNPAVTTAPSSCDSNPVQQKRDQFISTLMHDLRNPIGAIANGAVLLKRLPLDERAAAIADMLQECTQKVTQILEEASKKTQP